MLDSLVSYTHILSTILFVRCASTARLFFVFKCVVVWPSPPSSPSKKKTHSLAETILCVAWMDGSFYTIFTLLLAVRAACSATMAKQTNTRGHGSSGRVSFEWMFVFLRVFDLFFLSSLFPTLDVSQRDAMSSCYHSGQSVYTPFSRSAVNSFHSNISILINEKK